MQSEIRIHKSDCCHSWGIEFNYDRQFWEADANDFVLCVNKALQDAGYSQKSKWFHQCGAGSIKDGKYYGYQFFECFDENAQFISTELANAVANKIGTTVKKEK